MGESFDLWWDTNKAILAESCQEYQDFLITHGLSWDSLRLRDSTKLQFAIVGTGELLMNELKTRKLNVGHLLPGECPQEIIAEIFSKVTGTGSRIKLNRFVSFLSIVLGGKSTFSAIHPEDGLSHALLMKTAALCADFPNSEEDSDSLKALDDTLHLYAGIIGSAGKHSVSLSEYLLRIHYLLSVHEGYSVLSAVAPAAGGSIESLLTSPLKSCNSKEPLAFEGVAMKMGSLKIESQSRETRPPSVSGQMVVPSAPAAKAKKPLPGNLLSKREQALRRATIEREYERECMDAARYARADDSEQESVTRDFNFSSDEVSYDSSPADEDNDSEEDQLAVKLPDYTYPKPIPGVAGSPSRMRALPRQPIAAATLQSAALAAHPFFRRNLSKDSWTRGKKLVQVVEIALKRSLTTVKLSIEAMHGIMASKSSLVMFTFQGPIVDLCRVDAKYNVTAQRFENLTKRSVKDLLRVPVCNPDLSVELEYMAMERWYPYYPLHSPNHLTAFLTSQLEQAHYLSDSPVAFLKKYEGRVLASHLAEFKLGMNQIAQGYRLSDSDKGHITKWAYYARFFLTMWNRAFALGSFADFSAAALMQEFHLGGYNRDPSTIPTDVGGLELIAALRMLHCVCPVCYEWGSTLSFCNNCMFSTSPPKRPFILVPSANLDAYTPEQDARFAAYNAFKKANPGTKLSLEAWRIQEKLPVLAKPTGTGFVSFEAAARVLASRQDLIKDAFVSVSADPKELVL